MVSYTLRRILWALPMLLVVFSVVFFVMRVAGGDPAYVILGEYATAEAVENLREKLGLNQPLFLQYLNAIRDLLSGNFGRSIVTSQPIAPQIFKVLPYTLELTAAAIIIGVLLGIPFGVAGAIRRNKMTDYVLRIFSLVGLSTPVFFLGILLLLLLSAKLHWFPLIGYSKTGGFWPRMYHLFLPALSMGLTMAAFTSRVSRSSMLERLGTDYIRTARAKGLPESKVIFKHTLKDSMIPIVTVVGLYVGVLMGGAILTETIFSRPGLGKFLVGAIRQRDYNSIQAGLVIYGAIIVIVNLVVDIMYGVIDPRIKYE